MANYNGSYSVKCWTECNFAKKLNILRHIKFYFPFFGGKYEKLAKIENNYKNRLSKMLFQQICF